MRDILPVLLKDGYKTDHRSQYAPGTTLVYSNNTARKSRIPGVRGMINFGMQYFVQEYLVRQFNENFFGQSRDAVVKAYKRRLDHYCPIASVAHIGALHELGYLPLHVKTVPEGTMLPFRVPNFTHRNTHDDFFWLTNMLETIMSNALWLPSTSATTAFRYRQVFEDYARQTGAPKEFVKWQGHDFSLRGMAGLEAGCVSGAAHLLSFTGTDSIPAIDFLEMYYHADCEKELIGGSVPATEHSVHEMEDEEVTIRRLVTQVYPTGVLSVVSDTRDFWHLITVVLPRLKAEIMARNGKYVTRPDSGDPVKILCGDPDAATDWERKGLVHVLWDIFGGTYTDPWGYRTLDSHVGTIYGDSITPERQVEILARLAGKNFSSDNVVLGIGSFTYNYCTRDTFGQAIKATYCERNGVGHAIFKDPKTDDGTKKSAKGLLYVGEDGHLEEDVTWEREAQGLLQTVFLDGKATNAETLAGIRARIDALVQKAV